MFWCSIMSALKTLRLVSISNVSSSDEGTRPDIGLRGPLPTFSSITPRRHYFLVLVFLASLVSTMKTLVTMLPHMILFFFYVLLYSMDSHISPYFPVSHHSLYFSFKEFYSNACIIIFDTCFSVRVFSASVLYIFTTNKTEINLKYPVFF